MANTKADTKANVQDVINGEELRKLSVVFVEPADARIALQVTDVATGQAATLSVPIKEWDPTAKVGDRTGAYVDSADTYRAATDFFSSAFGVESIEKLCANPFTIMGKEFDGYFDGVRASLSPIKSRAYRDRLDAAGQRVVRKFTDYPLESCPVENDADWYAFNVLVPMTVNGETKHYRVTRFAIENDDPNEPALEFSTKYVTGHNGRRKVNDASAMIDTLTKAKNGEVQFSSEALDSIKSTVEQFTSQNHTQLVQEIEAASGINLDDKVKNEDTLKFSYLEVRTIGSGDKTTYYLVGTLEKEQ